MKPASVNSMYVTHARNYLDVEPQLPPPLYAPELVAEAIVQAAEHLRLEIYVGGAAQLLGMGGYHLPDVLDWGMKWLMFRLQRSGKPPRPSGQDNLHRPADDMLERGPADWPVFETSWYSRAVTRPKARSAVWFAAAIGLLAVLQARLAGSSERNRPGRSIEIARTEGNQR